MSFTFGIVTDGKRDDDVNVMIDSIEREMTFDDYEILVIGPSKVTGRNVQVIYNLKDEFHPIRTNLGWITRKKNIIAQRAKGNYIVFLHDYIKLEDGWYAGWVKFLSEVSDFEIGVNYVYTLEGPRHSDWLLSPVDMWELFPEFGQNHPIKYNVQIPIDLHLQKFQYISGGYWVATKEFSLKNPQIEECGWGEYEDIFWAKQTRNSTTYQFNPYSSVKLLRPNKWQPKPFPNDLLVQVKNFDNWLNLNFKVE
jgi:hypothetical protein